MSLNIKSDEAHRLAKELSRLTGENMTAAITQALRERIARLRRVERTPLSERILAIGRDCAKHMSSEAYVEHAELLYDENGMPK